MDIIKRTEANKPTSLWFEADELMLHAHQWVHDQAVTVIMIHGSLANNVWWQPIAAGIDKGTILSIDLSGHGLSAWSKEYSLEQHAVQVIKMIESFATGQLILMGHSYGGLVAACVATQIECAKVVLLDTPLSRSNNTIVISKKKQVYESIEKAVSRFKALPTQPVIDKDLLQWVGRRSLKKVNEGYTWQFDPRFLDRKMLESTIVEIKKRLSGRAAYWYGEYSPFATDDTIDLAKKMKLNIEMIQGAYHAMMLDAPEDLIRKIKKLIGEVL